MVNTLPIIILIPFISAPFIALSALFHRNLPVWLAIVITILIIWLLFPIGLEVTNGNTVVHSWIWIETINLHFSFRGDGLSLFFGYLILIIGLLIIIYAGYYLNKKDSSGRFFSNLILFMGSMLGIVLSENVIVMIVFWELTSITSFLLISFWQDTQAGRQGARIALAVTCLGGVVLLVGMLIIGNIVGSYQLTEILAEAENIKNHKLFIPALLLVLVGAFTKSAQFPFHFWLPQAMAAPTPVSAFLHSATMVKAGIFLLARFTPVFADSEVFFWTVTLIGLTTMFIGAYTAMFKPELKSLLAYSTISNLGLITMLLGFGTKSAMVVAIFHILNHAIYKAPLFMVSGIIDHQAGTREISKLSGLAKTMPITTIFAVLLCASMSGIPLTNGFLSKEMLIVESLSFSENNWFLIWLPIIVGIAAIFTVVYSLRMGYQIFFGDNPDNSSKKPKDPTLMMLLPVLVLVIFCIFIGLFPSYFVSDLLNLVVSDSLQTSAPIINISIWHGFNLPLLISLGAISIGIFGYLNLKYLTKLSQRYYLNLSGKKFYLWTIRKLIILATSITKFFQRDSLTVSASYITGFTLLVGSFYLLSFEGEFFGNRDFLPLNLISIVFLVLLILASLLTVYWHEKRMQALLAMAVVGLIVSLGFLMFSAPDLALTQLSVESVTIILLMLALFLFPLPVVRKSDIAIKQKSISIFISVASGIAITLLTLAVLSRDFNPISEYFLQNTISAGGGANAVNVILVDFRGIDTLGEITVLALAGLGVFALLKNIKLRNVRKISIPKIPFSHDIHPLNLRAMSRLIFPLMLLFAIYLLFRGHNQPGGGFIAGLVAAVALVIQYVANGLEWMGERMKINMYLTLAGGLLLAAFTGIGSFVLGYPFLTSTYDHIYLPIIGDFELASAFLFDLGVFLVVISATVVLLVKLGFAREK